MATRTTNSEMDARRRFTEIHQRLRALGTPAVEVAKLASFRKLQTLGQATEPSPRIVGILGGALSSLVAAAVLIVYAAFLLLLVGQYLPDNPGLARAHKSLGELVMRLTDGDIEAEPCLVDVPEVVQDLFRPPVNCSVCRGVAEIGKLAGVAPEEFERVYAYTARPVVVTDAMTNWTAPKFLSFEFFREFYGEESPVLESNSPECQFFPYKTKFDSLKEVFEMAPERANLSDGSAPWYIGWSNCDSSATNTLRRHYHRPYFLPAQSESSKTDWIFMGSPGYGAHMHIDDVELPSWQAQVKGHKRWTLEPPPECYLECRSLEVEVHPGEIIVLDTNKWFHQTLIIGDEMSITIGSEYD